MIPLQRKLRTLRSWQGKTLASIEASHHIRLASLVEFEAGASKAITSLEAIHGLDIADAYGLSDAALLRLIDDEYAWRVSGRTGNLATLPRLVRYLYRGDLPYSARALFADGFVVIDTETTGKDAHALEAEIVSITILDTDGIPILNSSVKPTRPIPAEATAIHGITDDMVADAPTFCELAPRIAETINGQTVIAYNADFDCYLLDNLFIRNGLDLPDFDQWCLMRAYADYRKTPGRYGNYKWHSLSNACEQQHVAIEDAHSALGDTLATWRLLQALAMPCE